MFSVDLVRLSTQRQIQKAILVTTDSDFVPAVRVSRDNGVEVWVWHGEDKLRAHDELIGECDECRILRRDFFDDILR